MELLILIFFLFGAFNLLWEKEYGKSTPRDIMSIHFDVQSNSFRCDDWVSKNIRYFNVEYNELFFGMMKKYSRLESKNQAVTRIYIWDGEKYLAYCEDAIHYFENPELLKTGRGYIPPNREPFKRKCFHCGSDLHF